MKVCVPLCSVDNTLCLSCLDFARQQVSFLPVEKDAGGQVSLKKTNIYQIQLCSQDCEQW